jgi:hypothetical protein
VAPRADRDAARGPGHAPGTSARLLRFPLEELRRAYGHLVPQGADPRHDTTPFRAFRSALLEAVARAALAPCHLSVRWEGTFNGYALVIAIAPAEAVAALDLTSVGSAEQELVAAGPRRDYPLAHAGPGRAAVARNPDGTTNEAPLGAATGHFGAPGMRAIP